MKLSETAHYATKWYETLDLHRDRALPTDVVIDRGELVKLLKQVLTATPDYRVGQKLWREIIQNIAGNQPEGHPKQGQRLTLKDLRSSSITMEKFATYMERTEEAKELNNE